MALFPVTPNPSWRPAAILDNFEWPYLRDDSFDPLIQRVSRGHLCDSTAFLFIFQLQQTTKFWSFFGHRWFTSSDKEVEIRQLYSQHWLIMSSAWFNEELFCFYVCITLEFVVQCVLVDIVRTRVQPYRTFDILVGLKSLGSHFTLLIRVKLARLQCVCNMWHCFS